MPKKRLPGIRKVKRSTSPWEQSYGNKRQREIATLRGYERTISAMIKREGAVTAAGIHRKYPQIPFAAANKVLADLERRGLHIPPEERARAFGAKNPEAIRRRIIVDRELTAGRTPKEILDLHYGGKPRRELLASDLEALRKYRERDMIVPVRDDPAILARVQRITDMIRANPKVSNKAMQRVLGVSPATIVHDLQRLPQSMLDMRIISGHKWNIGIERLQNELIKKEHRKKKRPVDVVAIVNAAMQKIDPSLPRMNPSDCESRVRTIFGSQKTKFATGSSRFTSDETARQNAIIKRMALQKRRSPDIADEVKKRLGHDLNVGQIDARISYMRKRGVISVERNPVRSQFTRQQIDAQNALIRRLLTEGKRPYEIAKEHSLQGLSENSRLKRIQKIKKALTEDK